MLLRKMLPSNNFAVKILLALLFIIFMSVLPTQSFAQASPVDQCAWLQPDIAREAAINSPGGSELLATPAEDMVAPGLNNEFCSQYTGVVNKAVKCITRSFLEALDSYLNSAAFQDFVRPLISMVLVIAVMVFGFRLMFNDFQQSDVRSETLLFIIKIGMVVMFTREIDEWYGYGVCVIGDALDILMSTIRDSNIVNQACLAGQEATFTEGQVGVWHYMDCFLGSFIMFNLNDVESPLELGAAAAIPLGFSMFGILVATAANTHIGFAIFFIGISAFFLMLLTIFRGAYYFLVSIMGIAFMFALSFLFIPCCLFKKTHKYFENWLGKVTEYFLQPLILIAFLVFAVMILDYMIYTAPTSLYSSIFMEEFADITPEMAALMPEATVVVCDTERTVSTINGVLQEIPSFDTTGRSLENQGLGLSSIEDRVCFVNFMIQNHPVFRNITDPEMARCLAYPECAAQIQDQFFMMVLGSLTFFALVVYMIMVILEQIPNYGTILFGQGWSFYHAQAGGDVPFAQNITEGIASGQQFAGQLPATFTNDAAGNQARQNSITNVIRSTFLGYNQMDAQGNLVQGGRGMLSFGGEAMDEAMATQRPLIQNPTGRPGG
jgi:type IV secretory pathway VirB6-like protein